MRLRFIAPLIVALACAGAPQQTSTPTPAAPATQTDDGRPRLLPIDKAAEDPTFAAHRTKLLAAVDAKDAASLQPLVDPNIRTDFGGGGGWADFRKKWELPSATSRLWNELSTILRMGGSFDGPPEARAFCAPYVYSDWPETVDAFEYLAVVDENVAIRETASADAPVVAEVDYEIVKSVGQDFDKPWRQVELSDGRKGFVQSDKVRSSIQYRACFQQTAGEWKMNLLVAGD